MYRVLLERGAEKDLARITTGVHDRVIATIQALPIAFLLRKCKEKGSP
jgi:prephenate dehydrogenase